MKKPKNIILPLTACMLLFTLTGCQSKTDVPEINTYHETIDPPADGWTDADIEKVLYINGKQISFPFTLDELGEGFTWDLENALLYNNPEKRSVIPILYYDCEFAYGMVYVADESKLPDAEIVTLSYDSFLGVEESERCMPDLLYFNGITLGSDVEQAKQAFGSTPLYIRAETYTILGGETNDRGINQILVSIDREHEIKSED